MNSLMITFSESSSQKTLMCKDIVRIFRSMINELLVNLVDSVLGAGKRTARGNKAYHCPYCNHHKPKLEINFTKIKKDIILGIVGLVIKR
jgi:hypothetical protein